MKHLILAFVLFLSPACQAIQNAKMSAMINKNISDTDKFFAHYTHESDGRK